MKNGFTLIELLAVIVVLAIIALIAVPVVLNIINDSKESSLLRSAEFYLDAVEYTIADAFLYHGGLTDGEYPITPEGNICKINENPCKEENILKVEVSGEKTTPGSKYECEVKPGTKYNFYVLSSESDGTTNLIMDRNICDDGTLATKDNTCLVAWISETDYECGEVGDCCAVNDKGPVTAMNYLNRATSSWSNIPNLNVTYNDDGNHFSNFKLEGKSRLPYHSEVNAVGCEDGYELSCPVWMVDYLYDAGTDYYGTYQQNPINNIYGYWTLSSDADISFFAWYVYHYGYVGNDDVYNDDTYGVRPVINIKL